MPEVTLVVKWPDEHLQNIYSPSTVIHEYFQAGQIMSVDEFLEKSTAALKHASDKVEAKFGFACTSAMASIDAVHKRSQFIEEKKSSVEIIDLM